MTTILFMPESADGPTNDCAGIGDVRRAGAEISGRDGVRRAADLIGGLAERG